VSVRAATPADVAEIRAVEAAAFGRYDEADLVEALRADDAVLAELVFENSSGVVGHILFSALRTDPPKAVAALAPVAVAPDAQGRGVGSTLCRAGIEACRALGQDAVLVLGEPAYYTRFGFSAEAARSVQTVYSHLPAFMALALEPGALVSAISVDYPKAFG
jgi:putative acetyltransferase